MGVHQIVVDGDEVFVLIGFGCQIVVRCRGGTNAQSQTFIRVKTWDKHLVVVRIHFFVVVKHLIGWLPRYHIGDFATFKTLRLVIVVLECFTWGDFHLIAIRIKQWFQTTVFCTHPHLESLINLIASNFIECRGPFQFHSVFITGSRSGCGFKLNTIKT